MTNYKCGDIILVKFIFTEGNKWKLRPALVLSTEGYHNGRQELIMAAITSNVDRLLIGDTKLDDWRKEGLLYPSLVTAIIRTIKQDMAERKLGEISKKDFQAVKKNLKQALSF